MKKIISIITLSCFIVSSVAGEALLAAADTTTDTSSLSQALDGFIIPHSYGRITESDIVNGNTPGSNPPLVINIQDIHCHPEVQRNISKLLAALDNKYGLDKVYVEGGYGNISTSWLCNINDKELRQKITENLIEQGKLTGSEYYSITSGRPDLLKGLEDESLHRRNIVRLGKILDRKEYFESRIKELERSLEFMKAKHLCPASRRFNDTIAKHKNGRIKSEKYYKILAGYNHAVNMDAYPAINDYLDLKQLGGKIKYKRIPQQLRLFMQALKSRVSFGVYNSLLQKTDNFSNQDELYIYLAKLGKRPELIDFKNNFKDLYRFFDYVEKNQNINPVQLIEEEKRLTQEIRLSLCRDTCELEVSFLADFFQYFKDYLLNRLAADDYAYFTRRFEKFRKIWGKYAFFKNEIEELSGDFEILNEYYKVNSERNEAFLNNIPILHTIAATSVIASEAKQSRSFENQRQDCLDADASGNGTQQPVTTVSEALKNSQIIVMVTGGFHTAGIKQLLRNRNISHLVITPNVTKDSKHSNSLYVKLARQQADILSNSLALTLTSELIGDGVSLSTYGIGTDKKDTDAQPGTGERTLPAALDTVRKNTIQPSPDSYLAILTPSPISIVVIGMGRWGRKILLNNLAAIVPENTQIFGVARSNYHELKNSEDIPKKAILVTPEIYLQSLLYSPFVATVFIATQYPLHYMLAKQALEAGKHVFIEKPITQTQQEAEDLIRLASEKGKQIAVGYEYIHNPYIHSFAKALPAAGKIREIEMYFENLPIQERFDTSATVAEDLAGHMFSILHVLLGKIDDKKIINLQSIQGADKAQISFSYEQIPIYLSLSRKSKREQRKIVIKGSKLIIAFDFRKNSFELKDAEGQIIHQDNPLFPDVLKQQVLNTNSVKNEIESFLDSINSGANIANSASEVLWISVVLDRLKHSSIFSNYLSWLAEYVTLKDVQKMLLGKPIEAPFSIEIHPYFELQPRPCNNNCIWCTRGEDKTNLLAKKVRGIEPEKLIALIKSLKTMGVQRVLFSGNSTEPLLYPDIDKVIKVVKESGLSLKLFSNFYYGEKLLNVAKYLRQGDTIRISLDAGGENAYNKTHKATDPKAFTKILNNIENLSNNRDENGNQFEIAIAFLITKLNSSKDDIVYILNWARNNKINDIRFSFPLIPKVGYANFNESMLLDDKEADDVKAVIENFKNKYPEYAKTIHFRELDPGQPDKPFSQCHIWKLIPVLGASGRFFPCTSISLVETMDDSGRGDINSEDFNFVTFWKDSDKWKHLDPQKCANGKCSDCTFFEHALNKRIEEELIKDKAGFLGVGKQALAAAIDALEKSLGVKFAGNLQLAVSNLLQQAQGDMRETGRKSEYDVSRIATISEPAARTLDYFNRLRTNEGKTHISKIIFKEYNTNYVATSNGLGLARIETLEAGTGDTLNIDTAKFANDTELMARLAHEIAEELALNMSGSLHYKALDYFLGKNHKARSDIPAIELFEYWHACEKDIAAHLKAYEALAITEEEKADITHLTAHARADAEHLNKSIPTISAAIADLLMSGNLADTLRKESTDIATTIQSYLASYLAILTPSPISRQRISRSVIVNGQAVELREAGDSTIDISVYPTPTKVDSVRDYLKENGFEPSEGLYIGNQTNSLEERDGALVTIKGLTVLAVDEDQNNVVEGARAIGKGMEATQKELERIANLPDEGLPRFIALDIDGTLTGKKTIVINGVKKTVYENILEDRKELAYAIAELYARGVNLSFFTDSNSKNANANVLEPLTKIISEQSGAAGNPIYFYANGQSTKLVLNNTGDKWERKTDVSYKKEAKISSENAALIMKILGGVEENDNGEARLDGVLGNYYGTRLAQKGTDGKYAMREGVKKKFTKISFGATKNGNLAFPSIQVRDGMPDGTVPQLAVGPLASSLNVPENEDLRAGLVKELANALEQASRETVEKSAPAPADGIIAKLLQKAAALFRKKSVFDTPADVLVIGGGSGTNKIIEMFKTHFKCNAQSVISFIDNGGSSKDIMDDVAAAWLQDGYAPKPARDAVKTSTIPHPGDIMNSITGGIDEEWKRWLCNGRANDAATFEELLDKVKIQCTEKYSGRTDEKEINSFVETLRPYFKRVDKKWKGKIRVAGESHSIKNIIFLACLDAEHACPAGWVVPQRYNKALERAMAIVGSSVVSLPASPMTFRDIRFIATLSDGNKLEGQEEITSSLHECSALEKAGFYDSHGNPVKVKASPQVISMIRNSKKIIIGPGSAFSSVLVNLMAGGVVEELTAAKKRGVEIVFLFNTTQDVETMNHTPKSLIESLECSINESLGIQCSFGDFVTHVVFNRPLEDDPLLKQFLDGEGKEIDEIGSDTSRRPLEIGKHALDTFNISEDDLAYFENKGISPLVGRFASISDTGQSRKAGDKKAVSQYHYTLPLLAFLFSLSGKAKPSRAHYIAASVGEVTHASGGETKHLMREIAAYIRNGNKYSILSGNTMRAAEELIISELKKELDDDDLLVNVPVVADNGAELWIYDTESGKYVLRHAVDMQKEIGERVNLGRVSAIISEAMKLFGTGIENRGPYVEMRSVNYRGNDITTQITFYPFGKNLTEEERKNLDLPENKQIRDACAGYLNERFSHEGIRLNAAVHGKTSIDILSNGIDKAYGIGLLARHFGVESGEFIYFGSAFGAGEIDAPVESKAGMLVNLGKGRAKNPKALNFTLENAGTDGLARFISVINLIDETIYRDRARERSLPNSSTYDMGSGMIQGLASFLGMFGWNPAILRDGYFIMRFSEIVAVIFNPLDLPFHARDNLNDYQKWGIDLVALITAATIFSYSYILHASSGFTFLAAAAAYSLSHPLYNIFFGTGTPANSPLTTGETKEEQEEIPPLVKRLIEKAKKNTIAVTVSPGIKGYIRGREADTYTFLPTEIIETDDLPEGYSTVGELRKADDAPIPDPNTFEVPDFNNVNMPKKDIILASTKYNGVHAVVRLGWLDDTNGTPVALRRLTRKYHDGVMPDDAIRKDYLNAIIADKCGIGPKVYGVYIDRDGNKNIVMDIVPGNFFSALIAHTFDGIISLQTYPDFKEIRKRLRSHGMDFGFDFQCHIAKDGHVRIIDPTGSLCTETNFYEYSENVAGILLTANEKVHSEILDEIVKTEPELKDRLSGFYTNNDPETRGQSQLDNLSDGSSALTHAITYAMGSGFIKGMASFLGMFGWNPAILRNPYFIMRFSEIVAVIFNPLDIPFHARDNLNDYQKWGINLVAIMTAATIFSYAYVLHASSGFTFLAAAAAYSLSHPLYNIFFGTGTPANSPLTTGETMVDKYTDVYTFPNRLGRTDEFIFELLGENHAEQDTLVIDFGIGFPPYTASELAKKLDGRAKVVGVDINVPEYALEVNTVNHVDLRSSDDQFVALFDRNGRLTHAFNKLYGPVHEKDKHYATNVMEHLIDGKRDEYEGNYLTRSPMKEYETDNLSFDLGGFSYNSKRKAKIIRVFNVMQHYGDLTLQNVVNELGQSLEDGGLIIVGENNSRNVETLIIYRKTNGLIAPWKAGTFAGIAGLSDSGNGISTGEGFTRVKYMGEYLPAFKDASIAMDNAISAIDKQEKELIKGLNIQLAIHTGRIRNDNQFIAIHTKGLAATRKIRATTVNTLKNHGYEVSATRSGYLLFDLNENGRIKKARAGNRNNLTSRTQVLLDYHYLPPSATLEAVNTFGASTIDEQGNMHLNVFIQNRKPADMDRLRWEPAGISVEGKPLWASVTAGVLMLLAEDADMQSIVESVNNAITERERIKPVRKATAKMKYFFKSLGIGLKSKGFKTGIIIDWTTDAKYITYNPLGMLKAGRRFFSDDSGNIDAASIPATLGDMLAGRNADSFVMARSNSLHVDIELDRDRNFIKNKLVEIIKTFEKTGGGRLIFDDTLINLLGNKTAEDIAERAKNSGVKACVNLTQKNPAESDHYIEMGFEEYCLETGDKFVIHGLDGNGETSDILSGYANDAELLRQLYHKSANVNKTLKLSELTTLLRGGERDILEIAGITEMFRTLILGMYNPVVIDKAYVRKAAHALAMENLGATSDADMDELVATVARGDNDLIAAVRKLNKGCVNLYMEKMAQELKATGRENETTGLQNEFAKAVVERLLAINRLKNAELANHELEVILGEKLLAQRLMASGSKALSITPDDFVSQNDVETFAFYSRLNLKIKELCAAPDIPEAVNATIELIATHAERKIPKNRIKKEKTLNAREITKLLENA